MASPRKGYWNNGAFSEIRNCRFCGEGFEAYHPAGKFCSDKCRDKQRYKNHKKHRQTEAYKKRQYKWTHDYRRKAPWRQSYYAKKSQCKKRGWGFELTMEWYRENHEKGCAITNLPFEYGEGRLVPRSATVDRIDHGKDYTPENCRMVLHAVNSLRGTGGDEEMYEIAKAIVKEATL